MIKLLTSNRERGGRMDLERKKFLIGLNITYYRRKKHLTQSELSAQVGISSNYISQIERGSKCISLEKLFQVAEALGVEDRDLLDYSRETQA